LDPRERALSSSDLWERVLEPPPIDGICSGLPPQDGKVEGERVDYRREGEGGEREWREGEWSREARSLPDCSTSEGESAIEIMK
jgi:hypothetical protein